MGEFGAVSVVSGHITGQTDTMPLRVEKLYNEYNAPAAFAVASLLALLALVTLGIKTFLEWKQARDYERAQYAMDRQRMPVTQTSLLTVQPGAPPSSPDEHRTKKRHARNSAKSPPSTTSASPSRKAN